MKGESWVVGRRNLAARDSTFRLLLDRFDGRGLGVRAAVFESQTRIAREVRPGGPGHALARVTPISGVTEVGVLPFCRVALGDQRHYDPSDSRLPLLNCTTGLFERSLLTRRARRVSTKPCVRAASCTPRGPDHANLRNLPVGRTWAFTVT